MSPPLLNIGFLASHGGSAMRFLHRAIVAEKLPARIVAVIVNNRYSHTFQWGQEHHLPVQHISAKTHPDPACEDLAIRDALCVANTDMVILSGYMKRLGPRTLSAFPNAVLNIHPSLLPKFGGQGMYGDRVHRAVLEARESVSGATVHFVNRNYDEGSILEQTRVKVEPTDSVDTLRRRVQAQEGPLYLRVLKRWIASHPAMIPPPIKSADEG